MSNIQHSSASNEWYTPSRYVEAAHSVLGWIEFDPFSCEYANTHHVRAIHYLEEGGFDISNWTGGNLWINPPGGKDRNRSRAQIAWECLMAYRALGNLNHAIFLGFAISHLSITQKPGQLSMCNFPVIIPDQRIQFFNEGGSVSPTHANAIAYIPGKINETLKFLKVFSEFGAAMLPVVHG
jgi:hypothetical protein